MNIFEHYARRWSEPLETILPTGPRRAEIPGVSVGVYRYSEAILAYATRGMSPDDDEHPIELFALGRREDHTRCQWPMILPPIAHYHRLGSRLAQDHTVNFGMPWVEDSLCSFGLLSRPYLDGPSLERPPGSPLQVLWLVPITEAERDFKREHGIDALEERFEEASLDTLNPRRLSVV